MGPKFRRKVQAKDTNLGIIIREKVFKITSLDEIASGGSVTEMKT